MTRVRFAWQAVTSRRAAVLLIVLAALETALLFLAANGFSVGRLGAGGFVGDAQIVLAGHLGKLSPGMIGLLIFLLCLVATFGLAFVIGLMRRGQDRPLSS